MALAVCKECKTQVSTNAKTCPKCGTPHPTRSSMAGALGAVFIGIVGLFVMIGMFGGSGNSSRPSAIGSTASAAPAPRVEEPPITVDARTLWQAYDANEVAADNQYKGHKLLVAGVVSKIDKDFMGNIVLWLKTGNEFEKVMAKMDSSEANQAAGLNKRAKVTLLCEGGSKIIGSPTMHDCRFQ